MARPSSPRAFEDAIHDLREREIEKVQAAEPACSRVYSETNNPIRVTQALYDELDFGDGALGYVESGHIPTAAYFHSVIIKELFPIATEAGFRAVYGLSVADMAWLVGNGLMTLLVQDPQMYLGLDYLRPLFVQHWQRMYSYEIRDRQVFKIISDGRYLEYIERAESLPQINSDEPWDRDDCEDYELYVDRPHARWDRRNIQRYAALSSLCGAEVVDELLALKPGGPTHPDPLKHTRHRLHVLQRLLIHPVTQGLGVPVQVVGGRTPATIAREAAFATELEATIQRALPISAPDTFSAAAIDRAQSHRLPERFGALYEELAQRGTREELTDDTVSQLSEELSESIAQVDRDVRTIDRVLRISTASAPSLFFTGHPQLAAATAIPELVGKRPLHRLSAAARSALTGDKVPWLYWKAARAGEKVARDLRR